MSQQQASASDKQPLLPAPIPANPHLFPPADHSPQEEWQEVAKIVTLLSALLAMLLSIVLFAHHVHNHHHGVYDPVHVGVDDGGTGDAVAEMWKRHVEDIFSGDRLYPEKPATRVMAPKRTRTVSAVSLL